MNTDEYLQQSERTEKKFSQGLKLNSKQVEILHAVLGLSSEAGELVDLVKRHLVYDAPLDEVNLIEEVGDLLWYCCIILRLSGVSYSEVMQLNIDKLKVRYPQKFSESKALKRDIVQERAALERQHT